MTDRAEPYERDAIRKSPDLKASHVVKSDGLARTPVYPSSDQVAASAASPTVSAPEGPTDTPAGPSIVTSDLTDAEAVGGRVSPARISAWAAVAGVLVSAVGIWIATSDDDAVKSSDALRLGPIVISQEEDALAASGTYRNLEEGEAVVFMVQPAEDDTRSDPWIILFAERDPEEGNEGRESGEWRARVPLANPDQTWKHSASIAPEIPQGAGPSALLNDLAEQGPDAPILRDTTEVQVYQPTE